MFRALLTVRINDSLFRGVTFPKAFYKSQNKLDKDPYAYRVCAPELALNLSYEEQTHTIETSVVWDVLAPLDEYMHGYGCRLAARRNSKGTRSEFEPSDTYCGAYQVTLGRLKEKCLTSELAEVTGVHAEHAIELDGEIAHANLRFVLDPANPHSNDEDGIEFVKTAIIDRVWAALRGPIKHVCVDAEEVYHPSEKLPIPPLGGYCDERSVLTRLGMFLRFMFLRVVLRAWGLCAGRRFVG